MKKNIIKNLLGKAYVTGSLPYVEFKEGNGITFGQDFSWWDELPANVRFYAVEETGSNIWLIADRYGIQKNNKWGLAGNYGNGRVCVSTKDMPKDLLEWCRANFL